MIKTKDLGSITYKISFIDGDVRIKIERCGQELYDVLKTLKQELLEHDPDAHRRCLCDWEFKVMRDSKNPEDEPSYYEVSPQKWTSLKQKKDWSVYYVEVESKSHDFKIDLQFNEWDDDPLVGDMFISMEYWDSMIIVLREYNLITTKQSKRFHLF